MANYPPQIPTYGTGQYFGAPNGQFMPSQSPSNCVPYGFVPNIYSFKFI